MEGLKAHKSNEDYTQFKSWREALSTSTRDTTPRSRCLCRRFSTVAVVKRSLTCCLCTVSPGFSAIGSSRHPSHWTPGSRTNQLFTTLLSLSLPQHLQTNQRLYQYEEDEPKVRNSIRGLRLRAHQGSPRPRLSILRNPAGEVHHGPPLGANTSSSSRKRCRNQWTSDISDDCSGDIQEWSYDMMSFVRHVQSLLCSRS